MAISARLSRTLTAKLRRYCAREGITQTAALEQGLSLLFSQESEHKRPNRSRHHASFEAYLSLEKRLSAKARGGSYRRSSDAARDKVRAKYSR